MAKVKTKHMDKRSVAIVYIVFQILIILTMVGAIIRTIFGEDKQMSLDHVFLCVIALILFNVPSFMKRKWSLYIPSVFQIGALIFIYANFIVGEIGGVYANNSTFDKILHTISGLAFSALGFSLVNLLNEDKNTSFHLSPFFVAFFAFCFSMMVAALWEVYEFSMDTLFGLNMQRWQMTAEEIAAAGSKVGWYGLDDTMIDMIVCFIGSLVISIAGFISLKTKGNFLNKIMLRQIKDYDESIVDATEVGDTVLLESLLKAKEIAATNDLKDKDKDKDKGKDKGKDKDKNSTDGKSKL